MAVLFSAVKDGVKYQVRSAGASRRLYTNDAFHTQYHPDNLFTGAVWDLLSLPSLCCEPAPAKVLVLGVAGGTVIHQLDALHQQKIKSIIGVELDAIHIKLANDFFDLQYDHLQLVQSDAAKWLKQSRQKFDYIVDDVFLHGVDDPARPVELDRQWYDLLTRHLTARGVLVQNHIDSREAKKARRFLPTRPLLKFETAQFDNQVIAAFPVTADVTACEHRLHNQLLELPASERRRLRFRCSPFSA